MGRDYESIYDGKRTAAADISRKASAAGRDIGSIPPCLNQQLKDDCRFNLRLFLESYFPATFSLAWSSDHLKIIAKLQTSILEGGCFALAMPRASGKTSITERAALWALVFGHRRFVVLVGSTDAGAKELLESIKAELDFNDALASDFPEVCYPIRSLEGISLRANAQTCEGERTNTTFTANEIVLPTIKGSPASGAIVKVASITGRIRGMKTTTAQGETLRPDFVIIDDPQTSESAGSVSQTYKRVRIIQSDILELGGPGKKIAAVMPVTVIQTDDLASRFLDRKKYPQWHGEKCKFVLSFPKNEKLWENYSEIRSASMIAGEDATDGNEYYSEHRSAMDEGAETSWAERFFADELSSIQHAMNKRFDDEASFFAEYQNEPISDSQNVEQLSAQEICSKQNGLKRRIVPLGTTTVTAFGDVQGEVLYYIVVAWMQDFGGAIIDYGSYPDQKSEYFTLQSLKKTLSSESPGAQLQGRIYAGLEKLTEQLLGTTYFCEDGSEHHISRLMIDSGFEMETVRQFCRQSPHAARLYSSRGQGKTAKDVPLNEYKRKSGDKVGWNWRYAAGNNSPQKYMLYDANSWKTFVQQRLAVAKGDRGGITLFRGKGNRHRMIGEHLSAEYAVETQGRGRTLQEWSLRVGRDNHLLDCLVGAAVLASEQGCKAAFGQDMPTKQKRRRKKVNVTF